MKLTVQLQLLPDDHADLLLRTMEAFNAAASHAARIGFGDRVFSQPAIHKRCYRELRERYSLSAQMAVRAIGKAVEAFRRDRDRCPQFRTRGAITYDERILSWKGLSRVSLWTLDGRKVLAYIFGEYQSERLDRLKGQVDLIYRRGRFYLLATIDMPEEAPIRPTKFIGVDLGIVNLATASEGGCFSGANVEATRMQHGRIRRSLSRRMSRGHSRSTRRNARRAMRRIGDREKRFRHHTNHCIAKALVQTAKDTGRGIALEELTGIRRQTRFRRAQRAQLGGWAFSQLRQFIEYKAKLAGIPVVVVDPRETSRRCAECGHTEKANRPRRDTFHCCACNHQAQADHNAARNIAQRGALVMGPEGSEKVATAA